MSDGPQTSNEDEDPSMGNSSVVQDFSDLKTALANVKGVLTPFDWIEFAQTYESQRAIQNRVRREEKARKIALGEDSDDEPPDDREKRQFSRMEMLAHNEHLKGRIVEVHGYFSDVVQLLLKAHEHLTEDANQSQKFVAVMRFVPKNSRDAVERLTERNNELEEQVGALEARIEEIEEYEARRKNVLLERTEQYFVNLREQRLIRNTFSAFRCITQTDVLTRMREELKTLRNETKTQKKTIKKMTDEMDTIKKLLESFKSKHEKQVKVAQEQLVKLHQLEDTLENRESQIMVLESEKANLELSLRDEVARRKDAEYALERTQEQLLRKTEEYEDLDERHTVLQADFARLEIELKIAQDTLAAELARMEKERIDMDKKMKSAAAKVARLEREYAALEQRMMEKVTELTNTISGLMAAQEKLEWQIKKLEEELADTIRQWHENVAQVRKECADEIERRGKEIYAAFAHERETHVRRLKIQNYELAKRDLYCTSAQDLNPLPLPEFTETMNVKGDGSGSGLDHAENAGVENPGLGRASARGFCLQCKKQVVFEEQRNKRILDVWDPSSPSPGGRKKRKSELPTFAAMGENGIIGKGIGVGGYQGTGMLSISNSRSESPYKKRAHSVGAPARAPGLGGNGRPMGGPPGNANGMGYMGSHLADNEVAGAAVGSTNKALLKGLPPERMETVRSGSQIRADNNGPNSAMKTRNTSRSPHK